MYFEDIFRTILPRQRFDIRPEYTVDKKLGPDRFDTCRGYTVHKNRSLHRWMHAIDPRRIVHTCHRRPYQIHPRHNWNTWHCLRQLWYHDHKSNKKKVH
jgi:hypothetical protein